MVSWEKNAVASLMKSAAETLRVAKALAIHSEQFSAPFTKGLDSDINAMNKTAGFIEAGYDPLRATMSAEELWEDDNKSLSSSPKHLHDRAMTEASNGQEDM